MKISVAMAVYNGEKYLKKQLKSVKDQTVIIDELIIVDDDSCDKTRQIVSDFIAQNQDIKIKFLVNQKNMGYKMNFRRAIEECRGDFIFLCDQDDIWEKNKIEVMIETMKQHPEIEVLATSFSTIDAKGENLVIPLKKGYSNNNLIPRVILKNSLEPIFLDEIVCHNYFQGCTMCFSKKIKTRYLKYVNDQLPHDWILSIIASSSNGLYFLNMPLIQYRIHQSNTLGLSKTMNISEKMSSDIRIRNALDIKKALEFLCICNNDRFIRDHYESFLQFIDEYIRIMENRKTIKLIFQNLNPYYRKIKTVKSRILDVLYTI